MHPTPVPPLDEQSLEEIAEQLSREEGRRVTVPEVRLVEARAMRKVRQALAERSLWARDLIPGCVA